MLLIDRLKLFRNEMPGTMIQFPDSTTVNIMSAKPIALIKLSRSKIPENLAEYYHPAKGTATDLESQ